MSRKLATWDIRRLIRAVSRYRHKIFPQLRQAQYHALRVPRQAVTRAMFSTDEGIRSTDMTCTSGRGSWNLNMNMLSFTLFSMYGLEPKHPAGRWLSRA